MAAMRTHLLWRHLGWHASPLRDFATIWPPHSTFGAKTGAEAIRAPATQLPAFRQKLSDGWYQVHRRGVMQVNRIVCPLNEPLANGAVHPT